VVLPGDLATWNQELLTEDAKISIWFSLCMSLLNIEVKCYNVVS